ncbi:MAG: hypothetical protein IH921_05100, partial [Gemmatimonadetes bacterium]|nr:hypothetical protein [Gemmatimonadota bacterium]
GHNFRCTDCEVGLTLHRRRDILLCHYCAFEMPTPEECPGCHGLSHSRLAVRRVMASPIPGS